MSSESTIGGKTGDDHIVQDESISLRPRSYLNFKGSGVSVADTGGKTEVTIPGFSIGTAISGGTANSVLYIDGSGNIAQDPTRFTYVPSTSFKTFGIQNEASSYNFGDFAAANFGTSFSISDDEFAPVFSFQNNSLDGHIRLDALSGGAGTNRRFTFLKNVFVPEITSTELATFNQLLVSGELSDAYQLKVQVAGADYLVIDVAGKNYGIGDIGASFYGTALEISDDEFSPVFTFHNNSLDGHIRFDASSSGSGANRRFEFLHDVVTTDITQVLPGTVNRTSNIITSVAKTGGRTMTPTRTSGLISSITNGLNTWTFTRNSDGFITSWSVS